MALARTVILEIAAQEELDDQIKRINRIADVYSGLEWRVARNPEAGVLIPRSKPMQYLIKSLAFNFPVPLVLTLGYHFTDELVTISLVIVDSDNGMR